jgi:hypothetical protein
MRRVTGILATAVVAPILGGVPVQAQQYTTRDPFITRTTSMFSDIPFLAPVAPFKLGAICFPYLLMISTKKSAQISVFPS